MHQSLDKECPQLPAEKERPQLPHPEQVDVAGRGRTAKTFLGEQGGVKEEGIGLVAMPDD